MRRLSIVDLAGGQQPFTNESDSVQLVANGEIYNFPALRQRARGPRPHVPQPLRYRGPRPRLRRVGRRFPAAPARDVCARAVGWRARRRCSPRAIARAKSPLYWTLTPRGLLLASEVKALLVRPDVAARAGSRGARSVSDLRVRDCAAHDSQGRPQAPGRALPALSRRQGHACIAIGTRPQVPVRTWREDEAAEAIRSALAAARS